MKCPSCGYLVFDTALSCPKCNEPLPQEEGKEAPNVPPPSPGDWRWDENTPPELKPVVPLKQAEAAKRPALLPPAAATSRAAAFFFDHCAVVAATVALSTLVFLLLGEHPFPMDSTEPLPPLIAFLVLTDAVYFTFFTSLASRTPGKMILGLVVVRTDGSPPTILQALLRWTLSILLAAGLGVGLLGGWHDKMTGTYVARRI